MILTVGPTYRDSDGCRWRIVKRERTADGQNGVELFLAVEVLPKAMEPLRIPRSQWLNRHGCWCLHPDPRNRCHTDLVEKVAA